MSALQLFPVPGIPLVQPGDALGELIATALEEARLELRAGDVLVAAQKIFSRAEDRYVDLATVRPSPRALELAREVAKDARLVELILRESRRVLRFRPGVLVVEHRLGFVHANAGIDRSNVRASGGEEWVLLLPEQPDRSAALLRRELSRRLGVKAAVLMSDTTGRAWRNGVTGVCIGCAGLPPLRHLAGEKDLFGRPLEVTEVALADELAAAASLVMGHGGEALPVVVIRGLSLPEDERGAVSLVRAAGEDLFR